MEDAQKVTPEDPAKNVKRYLVNARFEFPKFGGIPWPPNMAMYGFVTFEMKEKTPGKGITQKQALAEAVKAGAKETDLTIESVSELPKSW